MGANGASRGVLNINPKYASAYERRKRKEELVNSRQGYGSGSGSGSEESSDESSEDEDGDLLTSGVDLQILKTINALRKKDDSIYDPKTAFFKDNTQQQHPNDDQPAQMPSSNAKDTNNEKDGQDADKHKQQPKKRYKDLIRDRILTKIDKNQAGQHDSEEEREDDEDYDRQHDSYFQQHDTGYDNNARLAYDDEQQNIRTAFLKDTNNDDHQNDNNHHKTNKHDDDDDDDDDDDNDDTLFQKRTTPSTTAPLEEDLERDRLLREEMDRLSNSHGPKLKDPRGDVQDGDRFLLDFVTNRRWVDEDDAHNVITRADARNRNRDDDDDDDDASLQDIEKTDDFESRYNFRFEEAAAGKNAGSVGVSGADLSVVGYARSSMSDTVRRKDDTRRLMRDKRKDRKAAERRAKEDKLRRLKNARREELEGRIDKIKEAVGEEGDIDERLAKRLMEGDFDADKFEQIMAELYDEDFYNREDEGWKDDKDVKNAMKDQTNNEDWGGADANMDEEHEPYDQNHDTTAQEPNENETYYDDATNDTQPPEDSTTPLDKKLRSKMADELYKLDYEDVVAGIPTRFKYRQVEANSYGLSTDEILFSRDATLKAFVGLGQMAPYNDMGEYNPGTKKRKRFREWAKKDEEEMRKEAQSNVDEDEKEEVDTEKEPDEDLEDDRPKKRKRRRQKKGKKKDDETDDGRTKDDVVKDDGPKISTPKVIAKKDDVKQKTDDATIKPGRVEKEAPPKEKKDVPKKEGQDDKLEKNNASKESRSHEVKKKKKKRKSKSVKIDGVASSRLASYGL